MLLRKPYRRTAKKKALRTANTACNSSSNVGAPSLFSLLAALTLLVLLLILVFLEGSTSPPALLTLADFSDLLVPLVRPAFLDIVNPFIRDNGSSPTSLILASLILAKDTPYS